jgi:hypothetical protein
MEHGWRTFLIKVRNEAGATEESFLGLEIGASQSTPPVGAELF